MFYLIGVGLQSGHLSLEAIKAAKKCKKLYFDSYTNYWAEKQLKEMEKIFRKKIVPLGRKQIEEGFFETLMQAKKENIALLVLGNPLTATTHIQLLIDAKKMRVPFAFIPGVSITNYLGRTGLDAYRFGRITTIVAPKQNFAPESFFGAIQKNHSAGYHTLCLLEIDGEKNFRLGVTEAIEVLESIEHKRSTSIIKNSLLIGLYGLAGKKQEIIAGNASKLKKLAATVFPQSLIVCAGLNEKEKEAVGLLVE